MQHEHATIQPKGRSPWALTWRKPTALAAAGIIGAGMAAATMLPQTPFAVAQTEAQQTVETPYGRAPLTFADIVERVRPAVLSINVRNGEQRQSRRQFEFRGMPDLPDDHPLNEFFRRFMPDGPTPDRGPQRPRLAQGSGFFVSADGYIVTNNHVIDGAREINVTLDDGTRLQAELVGSDSRTDIALLKVKDGDRTFSYVEFSDEAARVGDWALAVGNPFGLGGTVTAGIVSAHNRDIGSSPYDYLQIDAAVNRGNSGGPTFNLEGRVIGVNTAIFSPSGGNVGIAFAVPSELVVQVIEQLREHGTVARGWLGVTIQNVTDELAEGAGLDEASGAMVVQLAEKGPAVGSQLRVGDVIVEVNGERVEDSRDLARKVAALAPASTVNLTVVRYGDRHDVQITLGTFPSGPELAALQQDPTPAPQPQAEVMPELGLTLAPAQRTGTGNAGVVITEVDPESEAADRGLRAGDIILEVAGQSVGQPDDVLQGVRTARDTGRNVILMRIQSGEQHRIVALPVKKS